LIKARLNAAAHGRKGIDLSFQLTPELFSLRSKLQERIA
jgi:hypothetical protein